MARTRELSRSWPAPPTTADATLHLIGDLHFGQISQARRDKAIADMAFPVPDLHVQIGDATDDDPSQDANAKAWLDALPADWITVCGNHDLTADRGVAAWATSFGMDGGDFTVDVGSVRLIAVSPSAFATPDTLSQATLDWLDAQLAAADRDCLILAHYPLYNTVVGDTAVEWSSDEDGMYQKPDADLRAILNTRTRAKAWISGHTHSPTTATGFLKSEDVGDRSIFSINCSALWYTGRTAEAHDALKALYLSVFSDRLEVRIRDHGGRAWGAIAGSRVTTFNL